MQILTPDSRSRFLPLLIVFAVLVLIMPRTAKFNYDYRKGSPWPYETLISQFDFPILKTEEQILSEREAAGAGVTPYYRYSEDIANASVKGAQTIDLGKYNQMRSSIVTRLDEIYSKGVISDAKVKLDHSSLQLSEDVICIQKNKRATISPRTEVYKVSEAQGRLVALVAKSYPGVNLDSLFRTTGVYDLVVPNLIFDRSMTELSHAESSSYISPTLGYVSAEQKIVSRGEIVTPEIAQMLDSYKEEYNKVFGYDGPRILLYLGNIIIALALVVILYFSISFTNREVFSDRNKYYYLLTIFLLVAVVAFVMERSYPQGMYMIPFSVFALYLLAFFEKKVVLPAYVISLLPLLIFSGNGMQLFFMYLVGGVVSMETFRHFSRGWLQFINALIVFAVQTVVFAGFALIDAGTTLVWLTVLQIFIGSILTVALYPLIYLFERIFNLVSTSRLLELADTNNKLLQELATKAPGTFQHSLQVMNMADAAARRIDANVPLVRAAALYHDLGKMRNPLCFVENESSTPGAEKYHAGKTPQESARDIIQHVADGVEIARGAKLPGVITDFILTHHGTSATGYFLNTYLNSGGDPSQVDAFHYKGKKPRTKEQVILMICDSVEAASRTLKDFSPETCDMFVERMVAAKDKDGQFEDADITVREMNTVKDVLKTYLQQMYHARVAYPRQKGGRQ